MVLTSVLPGRNRDRHLFWPPVYYKNIRLCNNRERPCGFFNFLYYSTSTKSVFKIRFKLLTVQGYFTDDRERRGAQGSCEIERVDLTPQPGQSAKPHIQIQIHQGFYTPNMNASSGDYRILQCTRIGISPILQTFHLAQNLF